MSPSPGPRRLYQWLNPRGGIGADLTVTRLADESYMVVTAAATAGAISVADAKCRARGAPQTT
jgi:glycine cleavage system aminomethyltransferase T